jgi:putative NIF3 family GTP cyclohydrolase 1 type 2
MTSLPPLTPLVQKSMQKLYPLSLADRSWDNVGLLLEPPYPPAHRAATPKVLLTIDLTTAVADEALHEASGVETIVTYRIFPLYAADVDPIIFRGLRALTLEDSQQRSLLRLVAGGVGIYSPHTSIDGAVGGINDWLVEVIRGYVTGEVETIVPVTGVEGNTARCIYRGLTKGHEEGGYGRIVTLPKPVPILGLVERIKFATGVKYGIGAQFRD